MSPLFRVLPLAVFAAVLGIVVVAGCQESALAPGGTGGGGAATSPSKTPLGSPRGPSTAADYRSETLERDLSRAAEVIETRGYDVRGDPWRGFLVQQSPATRALRLRSGRCTVAAAAATSAVRELDLRVFDADGAEVGQDPLTGRAAALRFCPSQSGTYYLVARATAGNGLFSSLVFEGPAGLDVRVDDLVPMREPLRSDDGTRSTGETPRMGRP